MTRKPCSGFDDLIDSINSVADTNEFVIMASVKIQR